MNTPRHRFEVKGSNAAVELRRTYRPSESSWRSTRATEEVHGYDAPVVVFTVADGGNTSWIPNVALFHVPPACVISDAAASSIFQSIAERLRAIQETGLHTSVAKTSVGVLAALSGIYALDKAGHNRQAAREIMSYIESRLSCNSLVEANQTLDAADVESLSSRTMIGLIRSTYRVKAQLPAWHKAYQASWVAVRKQGKSPEELFVGLPEPAEEIVAAEPK